MKNVSEFYKLAEEYCDFIRKEEIGRDSVSSLIRLLMSIYMQAMELPETEEGLDIDGLCNESIKISINFSEQFQVCYWEVFNPYILEEPVCGNLEDDLSDIAVELSNGISEYSRGKYRNAIYIWKFGFDYHWGNHVVSALRALHMTKAIL